MDHTLWNKYGAALANSMAGRDAIQAYKQALAIRPHYVRSLVNIGLANANDGLHDEAVEAYLNAVILNPGAKHVWLSIRESLIQAKRRELLDLVD